ncbi:MAG: hypothetical protein EA344_01555 [Alkalicoccus sp.]|nr:MAG: hypothetical protein EA344_01555 [Alkalicoccus sp.]
MRKRVIAFFMFLFIAFLILLPIRRRQSRETPREEPDRFSPSKKFRRKKFDKKVIRAVKKSIEKSDGSPELDSSISAMPLKEIMDKYFQGRGKRLTGQEVRQAVERIYRIDVNYVSKMNYGNSLSTYGMEIMEPVRMSLGLPVYSHEKDKKIMGMSKNELLDRVLKSSGFQMTGWEVRRNINHIYGINLDGISALENSGVGIFSKGQWIIRSSRDLFIIASSPDDVEIYVFTAPFYQKHFGKRDIPETLAQDLEKLEFVHEKEHGHYKWSNPTGESAPDVFKTEAISFVLKEIKNVHERK